MILNFEVFTEVFEKCVIKLSDISTLSTPNLYTMFFQMKFFTFCCVIFAKGFASTHLVK